MDSSTSIISKHGNLGTLFEFNVTGTAYRNGRSSSSTKKISKKVSAYGKGEIFNNPNDFGFDKVHKVQ